MNVAAALQSLRVQEKGRKTTRDSVSLRNTSDPLIAERNETGQREARKLAAEKTGGRSAGEKNKSAMGEDPSDPGGRFDGQFRLQRVARHKGYIRGEVWPLVHPGFHPSNSRRDGESESMTYERANALHYLPINFQGNRRPSASSLRFTSRTCESGPKF